MPLCGHLLLTVTIWSAFVSCQKPSSVTKRHDVYIAGFFPYTPREFPESRIGRGVMPAVKLAVEHINDSPQVLRNYRLHMWWNDTKVSDITSINLCKTGHAIGSLISSLIPIIGINQSVIHPNIFSYYSPSPNE